MTDGRRPLLLNNRQMLQSICDNLSHVRDTRTDDPVPPPQPQQQFHKKGGNLVDCKARNAAYNQNVLQQIRESLSPFVQDPSGGSSVTESDTDSADRVVAYGTEIKSSSAAIGTDVKSAVAAFNRLNLLQTNGVSKTMTANTVHPACRGPGPEDVHRASPVSDISLPSDSSRVSSPHAVPHRTSTDHINGYDTPPPPVPPRQPVLPTVPGQIANDLLSNSLGLQIAPGQQISWRTSPITVDRSGFLQTSRICHGDGHAVASPATHQPIIMQNRLPKNMENAQRNEHAAGIIAPTNSSQLTIKYTPPPPYQKRSSSPVVVAQGIEAANGLTPAPMQAVGAIQSPVIMPPVWSRRVQHPTVHTASAPGEQHHSLQQVGATRHALQGGGGAQHLQNVPPQMLQAALRQHQQSVLQQSTIPQHYAPGAGAAQNAQLTIPGQLNHRQSFKGPHGVNQNANSPNFVSHLQTQVNAARSTQSPGANQIGVVPNAGLQVLPNKLGCHIEIRNNSIAQFPSQSAYPGPTAQSPRQLFHIHISNGQNRHVYSHVRRSTPDTTSSTPRSDSPISRTTNQSPISYLSTTSTNSDQIPDRPPPPYPGRNHANQPPIPPPRVPIAVLPSPDKTPMTNHLPPTSISMSSLSSAKILTVPPFTDASQTTDILNKLNSARMLPIVDDIKEVGDSSNDNVSLDDLTTDDNQSDISESSARPWCTSPIPERTVEARRNDASGDTIIKNLCPEAFKFFMEQRIENVIKSYQQRFKRRSQLESEMEKVDLSQEARDQMRRILYRKESNYIRLKRAKMDKTMFDYIKILGRGAFGEVALVRKKISRQLYAMKTLRKSDVLNRNQVAHVKAERDILAEADNEWVVRLYYSFQDENNLYFVMDYVAGGDLMGLLIKFEIFSEHLARFYIAELVLAISSVHKMGFIHRDIKPDNILIDHNGHIKLTDFGLCTGFRWTHNSKYYQKEGSHEPQNSMDLSSAPSDRDTSITPLEHRRQRDTQRCLAHSLVGTPNYIAPEVLLAEGYTACCDWWSVGVIFYEMVIGQPPFSANSPEETQYKVINWKDNLRIPALPELSAPAKDLIVELCCAAHERLGRNGADELKSHPFLRNVQFEGLRQQKAPHVPTICYDTDTSNFDPVDQQRLRASDDNYMDENGHHAEHAFYEFTFRRFFDNDGHPYPQVKDAENNSPVYV